MLLLALIIACVGYLVLAVICGIRSCAENQGDDWPMPLSVTGYIFPGAIPIVIACVMAYLFIYSGVGTVAQFNAGRSALLDGWSFWVHAWSSFLWLSFINGVGTLIWAVICIVKKLGRRVIIFSICSLLLTVLTFFTVAAYFPSA